MENGKEPSLLVLSRKQNESLIINNDITIVVVEIRANKVRLGIEASKDIPIHRSEVFEAIQREGRKEKAAKDLLDKLEESES